MAHANRRNDRVATPTTAMLAGNRFLLAMLAVLGACTGGGDEIDDATLCSSFCTSYVPTCATNPQFCDAAKQTACNQTCLANLAELGDALSEFKECAVCIVERAEPDKLCSRDDIAGVAQVACADAFSSLARTAGEQFTHEFENDFQVVQNDGFSGCSGIGELTWNANDPLIGHKTGAPVGDHGWGCSGGDDCSFGHLVFGPDVTLPAGNYVAGFDGVFLQAPAPTGEVALLDVIDGAHNLLAELRPSRTQLGGAPQMRFRITEEHAGVQVRMALAGGLGRVSVDRIIIRRTGL